MLRRFTLSVALAATCALTGSVFAQTAETHAISAQPNIEMAAYARDYKSSGTSATLAGCQSCGNGGGGYATAGAYGAAGGYAGGPNSMAFGQVWGGAQSSRDCSRFYHYPYVYYPQNFMGDEYFRSSDSMYYRYPPEMQIPVYNRHWHNYYPSNRRYHWGHHFILDVF